MLGSSTALGAGCPPHTPPLSTQHRASVHGSRHRAIAEITADPLCKGSRPHHSRLAPSRRSPRVRLLHDGVPRSGLMHSTPGKSRSLSVTTIQSLASAVAAMIVSSALRGRPLAVADLQSGRPLDRPLVDVDQPEGGLDTGRLAPTVGPDHKDQLALLDLQVDMPDDPASGPPHSEVAGADEPGGTDGVRDIRSHRLRA